MRRLILSFILVMVTAVAMAQDERLVRGVVFDTNNNPIQNATITATGTRNYFKSGEDGSFIFSVPTYVREVEASMEGYISATLEIDGSYLMFKLKVDANYVRNKERERIAAEKWAAEKAAIRAQAEEDGLIAAEKRTTNEATAKTQLATNIAKTAIVEKNNVVFDVANIQHNITTGLRFEDFDRTKASFEYTIGYRFNRVLFAGIGTGISFNLQNNKEWFYGGVDYVITDTPIAPGKCIGDYFDPENEVFEIPSPLISIPLYANIRAYILDSDFSPYVGLSAGTVLASPRASTLYSVRKDYKLFYSRDTKHPKTRVFAEASLGADYKFNSLHSVTVQIGWGVYTQPRIDFITDDGATFDIRRVDNLTSGYTNLSVGLTF